MNKIYIALVGTNPIPVYISALKICDSETKIILIHTKKSKMYNEKSIGTEEVAGHLKCELLNKISGADIKLIECDKSDPKKIKKTLDSIKENDLENLQYKIYIDYTSGTKMMSATVYTYFKDLAKQNSHSDIHFCYIENSISKIIFEEDDMGYFSTVFKNNNVTIENIINLHGYRFNKKYNEKALENLGIKYIDEDISVTNGIREIKGYKILCKDFKICLVKYSNQNEKDRCKMDLFEMKDDSEKLGGSEAKMIYRCKCKTDEEKQKIFEEVNNLCSTDMKQRLKVINEHDDLEKIITSFLK